MEQSRRRWVVWSAAGLGLLVLVGAAVAGRDSLLERWHLWRLESPDDKVRADAARRLGELRSARAVPRLLDFLTVPASSSFPLVAADVDADGILDLVMATASSGDVSVAQDVTQILDFLAVDPSPNHLGPEKPYWNAVLAVGDRAVPALLEAARGDGRRSPAAITILLALPALPATAAPVLVECMVKYPSLGRPAASALGKLGPAGVEAALREPRARLFHRAVIRKALRARPEAALEVLEVLGKEPRDLESLSWVAGEIAGAGERILPPLARAVAHEDPRVALFAAGAILYAAPTVPPESLLPAPIEEAVKARASFAAQARASLPVAALARHLSHEDPGIRARTAELLGRIGPPALPALPALLHLLGDESPDASMAAVGALGGLGAGAVRPLLGVLKEAEARIRDHALTVLVSLGRKDETAVEALLEGLRDDNPRVASACASALGGVGALGALGARLERAVAGLQEAAVRPQESVRRAALQALEAIALGPAPSPRRKE